jgi:hypothetical protein
MSPGPLDPGQHWLEAGITGLSRQREWDAMVTVETPGNPGDEAGFAALVDGRLLLDDPGSHVDPAPFAAALEGALDRPYRAMAVRRPELWVVGASSIEVVRLEPDPPGDDLELTWDGATLALSADGLPADPPRADALARIATERERGAYSAAAHRLTGDLWELLILPL